MNKLDFSFEQTPWEATLATLRYGDRLSAVRFLALLEEEEEDVVEQAFVDLENAGAELDLKDLPKAPGVGASAVRLRQEEQMVQKNELEKKLDETDPLRLYLEEIRSLPKLNGLDKTLEDCRTGDENAMAALANAYLPEVVKMAKELVGRGVLLLDLIQEGSLGLWEAVQNWKQGDFDAYIHDCIRKKLVKTVVLQARAGGVLQKMRQAAEDYRAVDEKLLSDLGRNPTLEEIAQELHITPEEASVVKKSMDDARLIEQAKSIGKPKEDDPEEEQAVEDTAYFQSRQRILDLLSDLTEADAKLLTLRFGLEGGLPMSPEETGKQLNLTPEEVVTREAAALAKLRNTGK